MQLILSLNNYILIDIFESNKTRWKKLFFIKKLCINISSIFFGTFWLFKHSNYKIKEHIS